MNDIKYIEGKILKDPLLSFNKPDLSVIQQLRALITNLEIKPFRKSELTTHLPCEAIKGDKEKVTLLLIDALQKDYEENIADEGVNFDYYVFKSNQQPDALHIKTRLFHKDREGNIFYGRMIQRIADNEFLLWIDD
jgi:hypothetical protein